MAGAMFSRTATNKAKRIISALRQTASDRRGSYLVEAAITLPMFIIAVVVMSSVILMYSCIESCTFMAASELRTGAAEAIAANTGPLIPFRLKKQMTEQHSRIDTVHIRDYGYRVSRWGQDELIVLTAGLDMKSPNPLGIRAQAEYELSLVTRAYVGKIRDVQRMTADEMAGAYSHPVFIFPKRGEKYHSRGCGFLTASYRSGSLTAGIRREYKPCPLCRSRKASNGTKVYYFPAAGESYHLGGCPALERNYIEIDKRDAEARGYTPCAKCGG